MNTTISLLLEKALSKPRTLTEGNLVELLALPDDSEEEKALFAASYALKVRYIGKFVSIRGLVEASNFCEKDCYYCGIRKSNKDIARYRISPDEMIVLSILAKELDYGSIVIQSGESKSAAHAAYIEEYLEAIRRYDLGVTLSLGEQSFETYKRWRKAGASRYLLRIETSNRDLYSKIHPADCSFEERLQALENLKSLGYQVGTGVMIGLPGQSLADLARDIIFFGDIDADMIGMGPWIPHKDAPLEGDFEKSRALHLGLRMIAATRLYLHDVNIASATALEALVEDGRERGILAGANVIMPNITFERYRANYSLYDGKTSVSGIAQKNKGDIDRRLEAIGEKILYGEKGDSLHYAKKSGSNK